MRGVVALPGSEGARERLGRDLLRERRAHAPLRVRVNRGVMAIEDGAERRRLVERAADLSLRRWAARLRLPARGRAVPSLF
jgi:hypothetical protein